MSSDPVYTTIHKWTSSDGLSKGRQLFMWCPGCGSAHAVELDKEPTKWDWDGDAVLPTISPSILVTSPPTPMRCHSFVRKGQWQFLADCNHELAGKTVPMVPLPEWLIKN